MRSSILVALFIGAFSFLQAQIQSGTLTHDGEVRDYFFYLPSDHNSTDKYPLVLNLHGRGSNAGQQQFLTDMNAVAEANGFITVNPDAISNEWNLLVGLGGVDDVGFLSALIDKFVADFGADPNRVYSAGMSLGGFMSHTLACEITDKVAAIASVTGSMAAPVFSNCTPTRPIPVMQMHGTADSVVQYTGAPEYAPIEDVVAFWVGHNNCPTTPEIASVPDNDMTDSTTAMKSTYSWGDDSSQVIFYRIEDGGHTWPGGLTLLLPGIGFTNQDYVASEVIWDFFDEYDINGKRDKTATSIKSLRPATEVLAFPNPFNESLKLSAVEQGATIRITDINGLIVLQEVSSNSNTRLNTANLASGTYFLTIEGNNGTSIQKIVKAN